MRHDRRAKPCTDNKQAQTIWPCSLKLAESEPYLVEPGHDLLDARPNLAERRPKLAEAGLDLVEPNPDAVESGPNSAERNPDSVEPLRVVGHNLHLAGPALGLAEHNPNLVEPARESIGGTAPILIEDGVSLPVFSVGVSLCGVEAPSCFGSGRARHNPSPPALRTSVVGGDPPNAPHGRAQRLGKREPRPVEPPEHGLGLRPPRLASGPRQAPGEGRERGDHRARPAPGGPRATPTALDAMPRTGA